MTSKSIRTNKEIRGFMMFDILEQPIDSFITGGDGLYSTSVFDETKYPEDPVMDVTLINFIKFISTAYGAAYQEDGFRIVEAMKRDKIRKKTLRFRSSHPLFVDGMPDFQNACLISGLIFMGIPILPYFDGNTVMV